MKTREKCHQKANVSRKTWEIKQNVCKCIWNREVFICSKFWLKSDYDYGQFLIQQMSSKRTGRGRQEHIFARFVSRSTTCVLIQTTQDGIFPLSMNWREDNSELWDSSVAAQGDIWLSQGWNNTTWWEHVFLPVLCVCWWGFFGLFILLFCFKT